MAPSAQLPLFAESPSPPPPAPTIRHHLFPSPSRDSLSTLAAKLSLPGEGFMVHRGCSRGEGDGVVWYLTANGVAMVGRDGEVDVS